jgi:transposase
MAPISLDLRERILADIISKKYNIAEAADIYSVSISSVNNLKKLYRETGSVAPRPRGGGNPPKIDKVGEAWLKDTLKEESDLSLAELCNRLREKFGVVASDSSMQRTLARIGLRRKKKLSMPVKKKPKE